MNRAEIESGVGEILSTVLERGNAANLARSNEAAWDSLKHMQIVFAIEEKFGVRFSEEQIPRLDSFPKIVDCVYSLNAS
jgi:acyl carrier protein